MRKSSVRVKKNPPGCLPRRVFYVVIYYLLMEGRECHSATFLAEAPAVYLKIAAVFGFSVSVSLPSSA